MASCSIIWSSAFHGSAETIKKEASIWTELAMHGDGARLVIGLARIA